MHVMSLSLWHQVLALDLGQYWASECPDVKNYKWWLNLVWRRMLYSCTHMATVGVRGLICVCVWTEFQRRSSARTVTTSRTLWTSRALWGSRLKEVRTSTTTRRPRQHMTMWVSLVELFCGHHYECCQQVSTAGHSPGKLGKPWKVREFESGQGKCVLACN